MASSNVHRQFMGDHETPVEELQSPLSPVRSPSNHSHSYSPSATPYGGAQYRAEDVTMSGLQSDLQSPLSPRNRAYSPAYSGTATQLSPTGGRIDQRQSPLSPVNHLYSPDASRLSQSNHHNRPTDAAHYQGQYGQQSPQYSGQSPNLQAAASPAYSPMEPMDTFMALSPTENPVPVHSSNANVRGGNPPSPDRQPGSFTESNEHAAVRAPETSRRSTVLGPVGSFAAVSVSNFQGYPAMQITAEDRENERRLAIARASHVNEIQPRRDVEYSAPVPDAPVVQLGPGTDPPARGSVGQTRNTNKYLDADTPDRFEQFILAEGQKKCVGKPDTRTPNSYIFTFAKEDHTLGNLFKCQLLKDKRVLFSGYKVAHPLEPNFELRIQTDGTCTPKEALLDCCRAVVYDLDKLSQNFTKEFELRKIVGENKE